MQSVHKVLAVSKLSPKFFVLLEIIKLHHTSYFNDQAKAVSAPSCVFTKLHILETLTFKTVDVLESVELVERKLLAF